MALTPVGSTALWIAAGRALESESASPLFIDPYARELAGPGGDAMLSTMRQVPGAAASGPDPFVSIRTRFLDDGVLAAARSLDHPQVVLLAAGMDTRAFRLDWPAGTTLFEVDRDDVFDHKEPILTRLGAAARCDRRIVRADLALDWLPRLLGAGFDPARPAAFVIEGLLMYLEPEAADRLFESLVRIAADGNWMGGDIVNSEMLTSPFVAPMMQRFEDLGCPWRFGAPDPGAFLAAHGWHGVAVQPGEEAAHFGRWPHPIVPRAVPGMPRIFLMSTTKGAPAAAWTPAPVSIASADHYAWGDGCDGWHLVRRDALSVIQERMPAGTAEARHRHGRARQFFYVLSGTLEIELDGETHAVPAGSGLEVPAGLPHQVFNRSREVAEFLVTSQPPAHGDREVV
jgi:methyltransferase (TIGR00027 family)